MSQQLFCFITLSIELAQWLCVRSLSSRYPQSQHNGFVLVLLKPLLMFDSAATMLQKQNYKLQRYLNPNHQQQHAQNQRNAP